MEFVSNVKDMLTVVGRVELTRNKNGIQMSLPEESDEEDATFRIRRIVYGEAKGGKRYIETVAMKGQNWPVYGEASIPEILAFARKAKKDLPKSSYTKELCVFAAKIEEIVGTKGNGMTYL